MPVILLGTFGYAIIVVATLRPLAVKDPSTPCSGGVLSLSGSREFALFLVVWEVELLYPAKAQRTESKFLMTTRFKSPTEGISRRFKDEHVAHTLDRVEQGGEGQDLFEIGALGSEVTALGRVK